MGARVQVGAQDVVQLPRRARPDVGGKVGLVDAFSKARDFGGDLADDGFEVATAAAVGDFGVGRGADEQGDDGREAGCGEARPLDGHCAGL